MQLMNVLASMQGHSYSLDSCRPVYNCLMYTAPYALELITLDPAMDINVLRFAPYDHIANVLQNLYVTEVHVLNTNWILRMQSKLELSLPYRYYRDFYENNVLSIFNKAYHFYTYKNRYASLLLLKVICKVTSFLLDRCVGADTRVISSIDQQNIPYVTQTKEITIIEYSDTTDPIIWGYISP